MSLKSISQSPTQNVILSPLIQPDHLSLNMNINSNTNINNNSNHKHNHRHHHRNKKLSLSPQLKSNKSSRSSSCSYSSDSIKSPKSNKIINHLNLELTKPQDINSLSLNNVEDSPQLLATSVGAEVGSELVPSISNISLLSLNQQYNNNNINNNNNNNNNNNFDNNGNYSSNMINDINSSMSTVSNNTIQDLNVSLNLNSTSNSNTNSNTRFNSGNISSTSQRLLNLQRVPNSIPMQHAQFSIGNSRKSSFNSPTLQSPQFFSSQSRTALRRSSSNSFQQPPQSSQYQTQSQLKQCLKSTPIQIKPKNNNDTNNDTNNNSNNDNNNTDETPNQPDSPSLGPISLSGSPSNFLLSHNSPPNSFKTNSLLSNYNTINNNNNRLYSARQFNSQLKLSLNKLSDDFTQHQITNLPLTRADSLTDSIGGRSPDLIPVSTALPPMTPLTLSMPNELSLRSNSNAIFDDDDEDLNINKIDNNDNNDKTINNNNNDISLSQNDDIFGETIDD